jgi:phospholipid/cholesterol/gamma-HCH transport system substrate-binding protein
VKRAIGRYSRDFVAMAILAVIGVITTLIILRGQGAPFPAWIPVLGEERFTLSAEFSSAQAVTPGQGQTVNLSGVKVGDISTVELDGGTARVTMDIEPEYAELIHPDASMLMRPRTGLQDMTVQLDPGTGSEPIEDGATVPLANTRPNVNVDQILESLDGDTRSYLRLLLSGGAEGLEGNSRELSATLKRLEPTARDLARINGQLAKRRQNLARVIHNFGVLAEEVGEGDRELAEFVSASNAAIGGFADQEAALRETLREAPDALRRTRAALDASDRLSTELAPALRELIPTARALGPALRETRSFFERTYEPVREQIRPFTREVRAPVEHLGAAAKPLEETSRGLRSSFSNLNYLFDTLAYNPPGSADEGYLFWASWLNHNLNGLFTIEDAHGPMRRAMVLMSCATSGFAEGVTRDRPLLLTIQQLTRIPSFEQTCGEAP